VSYDVTTTRLHAKAWLFHRELRLLDRLHRLVEPHALGAGHRPRVERAGLGARNPRVIDKVARCSRATGTAATSSPTTAIAVPSTRAGRPRGPDAQLLSPIELRLEPFQERLLEQLALARQQGHHRNLLVAATGTGKTVMAASTTRACGSCRARACCSSPTARRSSTRASRRSATPARRVVRRALGRWRAPRSVRSRVRVDPEPQRAGPRGPRSEHFDVVIVDEFHHAAAQVVRRAPRPPPPVELLGLTATPERSDGLPVLEWFDGRIAAELRLWDAIDQHRPRAVRLLRHPRRPRSARVPWRRGSRLRRRGPRRTWSPPTTSGRAS
jgi:hypothetical protein